jgi:ribosomal protein S18 acetylase RimI-like enzyme
LTDNFLARKLPLGAVDRLLDGYRVPMAAIEQCELVRVVIPEHWDAYHRIRREVLFESRGRHGVYDRDHPDEFAQQNHPLLLIAAERPIGTARLDCDPNGRGTVRLVAVAGKDQRRGHGRTMMSLLELYAVKQGCTVLEVNSAPDAV